MSNDYYASPSAKNPLNIVRSADYNNNNAGIERAFDELPPPAQLARSQYGQDVSTAAALYEITVDTLTAGYYEGFEVVFQATLANTGSAQIQVNSSTIVSLKDSGGVDLVVGDILVGQLITAIYTADAVFQVQFATDYATAVAAAAASAAASNVSALASAASAAEGAAIVATFDFVSLHFYRNS
jgi:hypothetical protein